MERAETIAQICNVLEAGNLGQAKTIARTEWPFDPIKKPQRKLTPRQLMAIWERDGYIDRYSGNRLVYPGTLRLLARILPEELPYHKNGKSDECHFMHWELYPSHDHVVPIARGGLDDEENIVTTSMLKNQIKANWLLEEIGWELHPPGDLSEWNGLRDWFVQTCPSYPNIIAADPGLRKWRDLAASFAT